MRNSTWLPLERTSLSHPLPQQAPVVSEAQASPGCPRPPGLQAQGFSGKKAEGKTYPSVNSFHEVSSHR